MKCCMTCWKSPFWLHVGFVSVPPASFPLPEGPHAIRILQTTVFQNPRITTDFEIIALLGDVEMHSVETRTGKINFLQPWANSSLTPDEWKRLEKIAKVYVQDYNRTVSNIIQALNFSCEYTVSMSAVLHDKIQGKIHACRSH